MVEKPSPAILASIRTAQSQAFLEMYLVESGSLPDQFIVSLLGALSIHHFFLKRVCNAECRVWMMTAYFVPSHRLLHALRKAAKRGVDVCLLLSGSKTDHPAVRIFWYQPRFFTCQGVDVR